MLSNVVRDRARGYVVSTEDPVSEGGHCLLGSTRFDRDFIVTSTLASQCGPAVGRAMGNVLCRALKVGDKAKFPAGSLSFVSVGDGSVNNRFAFIGISPGFERICIFLRILPDKLQYFGQFSSSP